MFCRKCGSKLLEGAIFCQSCGDKLIVSKAGQSQPVSNQSDYMPSIQPSSPNASSLDDDLKASICKMFTQATEMNGLYLFENIPPKKLNNAVSTYASPIGRDEAIIMLYDSTIFGSAKDGFLLTSKRLYTKAQFGEPGLSNIDEISGINILQGNISIALNDRFLTVNMDVVPKEKQNDFHAILYETIEALGGKMEPRTTDVKKVIEYGEISCTICGNVPPREAAFCNWCGREINTHEGVPQPVYCHKCGTAEGEGSEICRACDERLVVGYCNNEVDEESTDVIGTIGSIVDIAGGIRDIFR